MVDYLGIFDDVGRALMFDEKSIRLVITNLEEVKAQLSLIWKKCVDYFPGVNRKISGYEGLITDRGLYVRRKRKRTQSTTPQAHYHLISTAKRK